MYNFGYYLKAPKSPYTMLAFIILNDPAETVPRIGQVVTVHGVTGVVDQYDIVPHIKGF